MRCPEVESIKTTSQVAQLLKIQSAFFFRVRQIIGLNPLQFQLLYSLSGYCRCAFFVNLGQ